MGTTSLSRPALIEHHGLMNGAALPCRHEQSLIGDGLGEEASRQHQGRGR